MPCSSLRPGCLRWAESVGKLLASALLNTPRQPERRRRVRKKDNLASSCRRLHGPIFSGGMVEIGRKRKWRSRAAPFPEVEAGDAEAAGFVGEVVGDSRAGE